MPRLTRARTARSWACSASSARAARRSSRPSSAPGGRVAGSCGCDGAGDRPDAVRRAVARGLGLMSQDRRETLVPEPLDRRQHRAREPRRRLPARLPRRGAQAASPRQAAALRIQRAVDRARVVGTLSGGNQQKVQVARWLAAGTRVLLLDDPTRGVDVGARAEIHALLRRLADAGCAPALVSSDAEELVEVVRPHAGHARTAASSASSPAPTRPRRAPCRGGGRLSETDARIARTRRCGAWPVGFARARLRARLAPQLHPARWSWSSIWVVFHVLTKGIFLTQRNLTLLALQTPSPASPRSAP